MFLPGTTIEVSAFGARKVYEKVQIRYGKCGVLAYFVCIPVFILSGLFVIVLSVAILVFAVQALVIGSQALDDVSYSACKPISEWMLIFGSFVLASLFCSCCCENRNRDGESKALTVLAFISRLFYLVIFCWICYGVSIVYTPGQNPTCTSSNYYSIFSLMVLFMFWGMISLIIATIVIAISFGPLYSVSKPGPRASFHEFEEDKKQDKLEEDEDEDEEQGLLRKA